LARLVFAAVLVAVLFLGLEGDEALWRATVASLIGFAALYLYTPTWRAVAAPVIACALLSPDGALAGMGAGVGMGLWLWLAFHVGVKPLRQRLIGGR